MVINKDRPHPKMLKSFQIVHPVFKFMWTKPSLWVVESSDVMANSISTTIGMSHENWVFLLVFSRVVSMRGCGGPATPACSPGSWSTCGSGFTTATTA